MEATDVYLGPKPETVAVAVPSSSTSKEASPAEDGRRKAEVRREMAVPVGKRLSQPTVVSEKASTQPSAGKNMLGIRHGNRQVLELAEDAAPDSLEFIEAMVEHLNSGYLSEEEVLKRKKEFLQQAAAASAAASKSQEKVASSSEPAAVATSTKTSQKETTAKLAGKQHGVSKSDGDDATSPTKLQVKAEQMIEGAHCGSALSLATAKAPAQARGQPASLARQEEDSAAQLAVVRAPPASDMKATVPTKAPKKQAVACCSKPAQMAATQSEKVLPDARPVVPSAKQEGDWPRLPEESAQGTSKSRAACKGMANSAKADAKKDVVPTKVAGKTTKREEEEEERPSRASGVQLAGVAKNWSIGGGYGFIDGGRQEYFCHVSQLRDCSTLGRFDTVTFTAVPSTKHAGKMEAKDVRIMKRWAKPSEPVAASSEESKPAATSIAVAPLLRSAGDKAPAQQKHANEERSAKRAAARGGA